MTERRGAYLNWIREVVEEAEQAAVSSEPAVVELRSRGGTHVLDHYFSNLWEKIPKPDFGKHDFSLKPWWSADLEAQFYSELGISWGEEGKTWKFIYPNRREKSVSFAKTRFPNAI